jgi:branched chain amino acid efflux pump
MQSTETWGWAMRAGAKAVAPQLIGVIPFGLVAGATPADAGLGIGAAAGFSTIVFAGASQLAAIDVLTHGGTVLVAVLAAYTINLRMVLYSASLAPYLTEEKLGRRMLASYLLVDQVYAVAVNRWPDPDDPASPTEARIPFMIGAGLLLWSSWQASTMVGAVIGPAVPDACRSASPSPSCSSHRRARRLADEQRHGHPRRRHGPRRAPPDPIGDR